ncbi:MAG: diguanylate cyclase domain-containing protein [Pseudoalteromonas sp.]
MKLNQIVNLAEMIELMLDAVCVVDKSGNIVFVSKAFEDIFGYTPSEVMDEPVKKFVFHEDKEKTANTVDNILSGKELRSFENRWIHKTGRIIDVLWSARWSEKHQVRIAVAHDITERKKMENELTFLANHDQLTKLPNRGFLEHSLQQSVALTDRENTNLCLFFIDVDKFKLINDIYGHSVGDEVLKVVAQRLIDSVRDSDIVGRLSGDEFLVILNKIEAKADAQLLAEKICNVIEQPILYNDANLQITVSIGIAFYPDDVDDERQLLQKADQAMYKAKRSGGISVCALFQS